jgi:hypothetical protein
MAAQSDLVSKVHIWSHQGSFSTLLLRSFSSASYVVGNETFVIGEAPHDINPEHTGLFGLERATFEPKWKAIIENYAVHDKVALKEHAWLFHGLSSQDHIQDFFMPESKHIFLLRRPDLSFVSYKRRLTGSPDEISGMLREVEMSLQGFEKLWNLLPQHFPKTLVDGGRLVEEPEKSLPRLVSWVSPLLSLQPFTTWDPLPDTHPVFGLFNEFKEIRNSTGWISTKESTKLASLVLPEDPTHLDIINNNLLTYHRLLEDAQTHGNLLTI